MELAPEVSAEIARLNTLYRYAILDTPPEAEFDDFTSLATQICQTPIALISLIDTDRQWFKSRIGLQVLETDRKLSFCNHTIRSPLPRPFVVPDAQADARFSNNPFVTSAPNIRFYAGAPITAPDGHILGTVCVLDQVPRELTSAQLDALAALSRQVMLLMETRRLAREQQQLLIERHLAQVALQLAHNTLKEQVAERTADAQGQFRKILQTLSRALDAKDPHTNHHSLRVCTFVGVLSKTLCPEDLSLARQLDIAARVHDIGKIGIPEFIINKPGRLTEEEQEVIRQHPTIGNNILSPFIQDEAILSFVRHHHKNWDGTGYPSGLAAEAIPLGARVLSVADAFDAMTSARPYRAALSVSEAIAVLRAGAGRQWDARVVDALVQSQASQP